MTLYNSLLQKQLDKNWNSIESSTHTWNLLRDQSFLLLQSLVQDHLRYILNTHSQDPSDDQVDNTITVSDDSSTVNALERVLARMKQLIFKMQKSFMDLLQLKDGAMNRIEQDKFYYRDSTLDDWSKMFMLNLVEKVYKFIENYVREYILKETLATNYKVSSKDEGLVLLSAWQKDPYGKMDVFKLEMSQQMSVALARNNLCYVEEILLITPEALSKKLGIDLRICREFLDKIRLEILPRPIENSNSEILLTGLQGLDELGGIAKGQLFEVFGEAGCNCSVLIVAGKTNFALSCAMHVALPREYGGNDGIVVYICTDHAFPINRFMTLLKCFKDENPEFSTEEILERVLVQELSVRDLVDFERILLHVIPALLDMLPNVKLIVIDSIAYNFRSEQESAVDRAAKLVEIANVLKSCCARYDLGVLLINQVTDNFDHDIFCTTSVAHGPSHWIKISLDNFDLSKRPALGLAWSNCVNTRCMKSI